MAMLNSANSFLQFKMKQERNESEKERQLVRIGNLIENQVKSRYPKLVLSDRAMGRPYRVQICLKGSSKNQSWIKNSKI